MDLFSIFSFLLKVFALLFLGIFLFKYVLNPSYLKPLSMIFINILIPAMIFNSFLSRFDMEMLRDYWFIPLISIAFITFALLTAYLMTRIFRIKYKTEFMAMIAFCNSGYIVLPMIIEFFKGDAQNTAMIMNFLYTMFFMLLMWSIGVFLITGKRVRINFKTIPAPFIITAISIVLGLLNVKRFIPDQVFSFLKIVGTIGVYGSMIILGGILSQIYSMKISFFIENARFLVLKNIVFPSLFIAIVYLMGLPTMVSLILSFVNITPPANNLAIITKRYSPDSPSTEYIYRRIFTSYIFSIITMPFFLYILSLMYK